MAGFRAGLVADCGAVFAVAARTRVAIEVDGDPARQDLDYTLARQALDAGCIVNCWPSPRERQCHDAGLIGALWSDDFADTFQMSGSQAHQLLDLVGPALLPDGPEFQYHEVKLIPG